MRICEGHWVSMVFNIVAHDTVRDCKRHCRAVGHMGYDEGIRNATCFVEHDQVCDIVGAASFDKIWKLVTTTKNSLRVGDEQLHLFVKLKEFLTGFMSGGNKHPGIFYSCSGVLIIHHRSEFAVVCIFR